MIDRQQLADKIEQTLIYTQFEPVISRKEWSEIITALRAAKSRVPGDAVGRMLRYARKMLYTRTRKMRKG